jgi:peptidoglycan/LPS O-acetylase OafA/YrhL
MERAVANPLELGIDPLAWRPPPNICQLVAVVVVVAVAVASSLANFPTFSPSARRTTWTVQQRWPFSAESILILLASLSLQQRRPRTPRRLLKQTPRLTPFSFDPNQTTS